MQARQSILLHPLFLGSLAVLMLNDRILKLIWPGPVTGKLSDFAGLIVLTLFLAAARPNLTVKPRRLLVLHGIVALAWVIWKLAPLEVAFSAVGAATGWPMPSRVKDPTDLIALAVLPIGYLVLRRLGQLGLECFERSWWKRVAATGVMAVGAFAILATSPPSRIIETKPDPEVLSRGRSITEVITIVGEVLSDHNMRVSDDPYWEDDSNKVTIWFEYLGKIGDEEPGEGWDHWWTVHGHAVLKQDEKAKEVRLKELQLRRTRYRFDELAVRREIIAPIVVDLRRRLGASVSDASRD